MLLVSIRPEYAESILSGMKGVEFRRRVPRQVQPGDALVIYASSPVCAIIGMATIAKFSEGTPGAIWREFRGIAGINRETFCDYYRGAERAVGIVLAEARRFTTPLGLSYLRKEWPGFHPPQQFAYLSDVRRGHLLAM